MVLTSTCGHGWARIAHHCCAQSSMLDPLCCPTIGACGEMSVSFRNTHEVGCAAGDGMGGTPTALPTVTVRPATRMPRPAMVSCTLICRQPMPPHSVVLRDGATDCHCPLSRKDKLETHSALYSLKRAEISRSYTSFCPTKKQELISSGARIVGVRARFSLRLKSGMSVVTSNPN